MKIRKALSLLLALVFAVSLVPAFTVTSSAVDYDPPARPVAWWNGTNVEWKPAEGALWYTVYVSYVVEGHDPVQVMDAIIRVDGTTVTEAKVRYGDLPLKGCTYDAEFGCFVLDASNLIQYENDKYMYRVVAINYKNDKHTGSQSTATTSAAILGSKLKAGETSRPHTITVTNGTANPSDAWAGQTVTITYKVSNLFSGLLRTFDHWEVVSGDVTLADASATTTTFTMPDRDVSIKGVLRDKDANATHTVTVTNGTATPSEAKAGETVTITYQVSNLFSGLLRTFDHWEVVSGGMTLADASATTTTFTMPDQDVSIKGVLRDKETQEPLAFTTQPQSGTPKKTEPYSFSWALSDTADLTILQAWVPLENGWRDLGPLSKSPASAEYRSIFVDGNTSKYRIQAEKGGEKFYSDEFTVTWTEDTGEKTNPFVDVKKSDPWYDAVLWAYYADPQVTKGVSDTRFGPTETVTRGQCAAFLWRAMGCPEPTNTVNPFVDVPSSQYYYKPILWAVEKGITQGTSARHFSPNDTLTTAHIVTFLYRAKHPGANGWYEEAGAWAEQGYGSGKPFGVNTPVNPKTDCPRGYVVMFLQKAK